MYSDYYLITFRLLFTYLIYPIDLNRIIAYHIDINKQTNKQSILYQQHAVH